MSAGASLQLFTALARHFGCPASVWNDKPRAGVPKIHSRALKWCLENGVAVTKLWLASVVGLGGRFVDCRGGSALRARGLVWHPQALALYTI